MDAPVLDQLDEGQLRGLAPDAVERREDDRLGVSSMMKSTPVRCSRARMFRPSRPMMRPFMSSDGSSTSVTVVSAAWRPRPAGARRRRGCGRGASPRCAPPPPSGAPGGRARGGSGPPSAPAGALRSATVMPRSRSSSRTLALLRLLQLGVELLATPPRGRQGPGRGARARRAGCSTSSSFAWGPLLGPRDLASPLLHLRLDLGAQRTASSRASTRASRRIASASRSASSRSCWRGAAAPCRSEMRRSSGSPGRRARAPTTRPINMPAPMSMRSAPVGSRHADSNLAEPGPWRGRATSGVTRLRR